MDEALHKRIDLVSLKILIQRNDRIKMYKRLESARLSCSQAVLPVKTAAMARPR